MSLTSSHGEKKFWNLSPDTISNLFTSDLERGLSSKEATKRLKFFGNNEITQENKNTKLKIFIGQFASPLVILLTTAGLVCSFIGEWTNAIFIFLAVLVDVTLGFYQENKADNALSSLKKYLKQQAVVRRDSKNKNIDANKIVLGDIINLSQGDRVPADARLITVNDFQVDEALLTGESLPIEKQIKATAEDSGVPDQNSMVFGGTLVMQGTATAIVCRVGKHTEIGKIATLLSHSKNEKTPLQKSLTKFTIWSIVGLIFLTIIVFIIGIYSGENLIDMFLVAIAVAVGAVPQALPVAMTVIMAVGVERMAKRKGVIRRLLAAETLGSTTVILTDKTGTLTQAKMVLDQVVSFGLPEETILSYALTNVSVVIKNPKDEPVNWQIDGKIMDVALVREAAKRGVSLEEAQDKNRILQLLPFNSIQKYSAALIKENKKHSLIFFGAPDILLAQSSLTLLQKKKMHEQIEQLSYNGSRVLGVAIKTMNKISSDWSINEDILPSKLQIIGLLAFHDPIRPQIKETITRLQATGIKTVIMTGDHKGTAVAVAKKIGLYLNEKSVLDASELAHLSDREVKARLASLVVVSRVSPADKLRIAKLFQRKGEIVAMTGDGVNDAPSIKQADIGIAMGSGTEVSRNAADLILLDDNFETIVAAIEEGRQILKNLRKTITYNFLNVVDGICLIGGSLLVGLPLPLNALQILWVNFFSDSFPSASFAFEREKNILSLPHGRSKSLFDPTMKFIVLVMGTASSLALFSIYLILYRYTEIDNAIVRTFVFFTFGVYTLICSFSMRSLERNIFSFNPLTNKYLNMAVLVGIVLMFMSVYTPFLQELLGTVFLSFWWVIAAIGFSVFFVLMIELVKTLFRYRLKKTIITK